MNTRSLIKIIEHESLIFISIALFSCVVLPTFVILLMAIFTHAPRTESLFLGYRHLYASLGGIEWVGYGVAIGPYIFFQCYRLIKWAVLKEKPNRNTL
jgi:hypothetical protein